MDLQPLFQHGSTVEREMRAHANSLAVRVATWALAGNGAALLLCFNAVLARQICQWEAVQPFAAFFMLGLVAAFGSVVFTMRSFDLAAARMMKINAAASKAASHVSLVNVITSALQNMPPEQKQEAVAEAAKAEARAREEIANMEQIAKVPKWHHALSWVGNTLLGASVLAFGAPLLVAIRSDRLVGALCS